MKVSSQNSQLLKMLIAFASIISIHSRTHAAIAENATIGSAKAAALANAVTAVPVGIDSIHYNPAGLASISKTSFQLNTTAGSLKTESNFGSYSPLAKSQLDYWNAGAKDPVENSHSSTNSIAFMVPFMDKIHKYPFSVGIFPSGGVAYHIEGSGTTLATAVYMPVTGGYWRDDNDPGKYLAKGLALTQMTYFAPSFGMAINDEWSIGASMGVSYVGLGAIADLRAPHLYVLMAQTVYKELQTINSGKLCKLLLNEGPICDKDSLLIDPFNPILNVHLNVSNPLVFSANIGTIWKPLEWFSWGAVYRSGVEAKMKGKYSIDYSQRYLDTLGQASASPYVGGVFKALDLSRGNIPHQEGNVDIEVDLPAHFATGISVLVTPSVRVNLDAKWTQWSSIGSVPIHFDQDIDFLRLVKRIQPDIVTNNNVLFPRHYKDSWNFAIGGEYYLNDALTLRLGFENRSSSIPSNKQDVLVPLGDAHLFAAGFEYHLTPESKIEFSTSYLIAKANIPADSSDNVNSVDPSKSLIYSPYAGLDVKTKTQVLLGSLSYSSTF